MYKVYILFYIRTDNSSSCCSGEDLNYINNIITTEKYNWIHYEIKEIEFEFPKERWIITFKAIYNNKSSIIYSGPFNSKKAAQEFANNKKDSFQLLNIFKEPLSIIETK